MANSHKNSGSVRRSDRSNSSPGKNAKPASGSRPASANARNGQKPAGLLGRTVARAVSSGNMVTGNHTYVNPHGIPDWRLERPDFKVVEVSDGSKVHYEVRGNLAAPVPPIRDSRYLDKDGCVALYRWMMLNRRMEQALENLYKQGKVVGGVYFGLGQEGCSCASAMALEKDDWLAPMIRNQGSLLVRGFQPRDLMMQYMAKSGSPTKGKDGTSHFGNLSMHVVSPISTLGELVPVMAGVALGARIQGRKIACMTYIGDGGQSTGVTYEGINLAAVRKLGLVLVVENNLWAYSTPAELQFAVKDLADRAVGYGVAAVIVDGTDPCQVYDACFEACARARKGEGPTLVEAKMMRMKGHAIHDAASYVPPELLDYWKKRDPIARFEKYLTAKGWLSAQQNQKMIAEVEKLVEAEREFAINSPLPEGHEAETGVYCDDGCHAIKPAYGLRDDRGKRRHRAKSEVSETALHFK